MILPILLDFAYHFINFDRFMTDIVILTDFSQFYNVLLIFTDAI